MSNIKRVVNTQFWDDDKIVNIFSPEDKYFFLYLLTNKHTTQLGVYGLVPKQAAFELGYSIEAVLVLLDRFETKYEMIRYSKDTYEVAVKNYLFHSVVKGGKPVMDCLLSEEKDVINKELLWYILDGLENKRQKQPKKMNNTVLEYMEHLREERSKEENIYNTSSEVRSIYINDNDNERYVNESYHESSTIRKSRFIPPTVEEVDAYCIKNNLAYIDPENFVDFYGSKGWMVGKNKMTNWHQAASGWNRRAKQKGEKPFRTIFQKPEVKEPRRNGFEDCPDELWNKLKNHFDANGLKWEDVNLTEQDIKWMRRKGL